MTATDAPYRFTLAEAAALPVQTAEQLRGREGVGGRGKGVKAHRIRCTIQR
jgi:hypothetical protein